jgi:hypothetical protein
MLRARVSTHHPGNKTVNYILPAQKDLTELFEPTTVQTEPLRPEDEAPQPIWLPRIKCFLSKQARIESHGQETIFLKVEPTAGLCALIENTMVVHNDHLSISFIRHEDGNLSLLVRHNKIIGSRAICCVSPEDFIRIFAETSEIAGELPVVDPNLVTIPLAPEKPATEPSTSVPDGSDMTISVETEQVVAQIPLFEAPTRLPIAKGHTIMPRKEPSFTGVVLENLPEDNTLLVRCIPAKAGTTWDENWNREHTINGILSGFYTRQYQPTVDDYKNIQHLAKIYGISETLAHEQYLDFSHQTDAYLPKPQ